MGNKFTIPQLTQELFDSYIASDEKFGDLSGKVVAITGTTTGSIGYFVAKAAVAKNAKLVLLLNRQSDRSTKTEEDVKEGAPAGTTVKTVNIDLLSFDSVKQAAEEVNKIAAANGGLDVLCCNAGIMARMDERTQDGFDVQMQANQLSHYLLTKLCMSSLEDAASSRGEARAVFHSSSARKFGPDLDPKHFEKCEPGTLGGDNASMCMQAMNMKEGPWTRYHQSKLANAAFAMALHDKLQEKGSKVKSLACEPGWSHSNLQLAAIENGGMSNTMPKIGYYVGQSSILSVNPQSAADGSLNCSMCCFSPEANSGEFYMPDGGSKGAPVKSIVKGKPIKKNGEKESLSAKNKKVVLEACEKAFGFSSTL